MERLHHSFTVSEKLREHILLQLRHGCMYKVVNNNLLYHASIPLNEDGTLREVEIEPKNFAKGKDLLHKVGMIIRRAFQSQTTVERSKMYEYAVDYFLYLWCGPDSPLFDKAAMTTSNATSSKRRKHTTKRKVSTSNSASVRTSLI